MHILVKANFQFIVTLHWEYLYTIIKLVLYSLHQPLSVLFCFQVGNGVHPVADSTSPLDPGAHSYVAVEERHFEARSPAEAILISFFLYYVFNFEYHHKFRRTFIAFEHMKYSKLGVMCTRFLPSLKKL